MVCACIDIGSNTTRVLVAEVADGRLDTVAQQRAFTRIGKELRAGGPVSEAKLAEVAAVVAEQRRAAAALRADPIRVVATAAIRAAANRGDFCRRVAAECGIDVEVLDGAEEARLAFLGATRTLPEEPAGSVGVVDVGGGSTEIAVGTFDGGVGWSASFDVGSGSTADAHLRADPPSAAEVGRMREHAQAAFAGTDVPRPARAIAVGGSATSMRRLVGPVLDAEAVERALGVLGSAPAADVAREFGIEPERVRLLPAGILVLEAAGHVLGAPLEVACGGLREGVCLELARGAGGTIEGP